MYIRKLFYCHLQKVVFLKSNFLIHELWISRHVASFLKWMVGRGGEQTHPKFLASKKKCKRKSSQNHENPFGVGGSTVFKLWFYCSFSSFWFNFFFYKVSKKRGGGQLHGNSNLREIFAVPKMPLPHGSRCYVPDF